MGTRIYKGHGTRKTPQSQPIPGSGQVPNTADGYAWELDDWARLQRFLVLGTDGGTYYITEKRLTRENADVVMRCLRTDGLRTVEIIKEISASGRAPKNTPAIFALAAAAGDSNDKTRAAALEALPAVCRTGTHLFQFAELVQEFRMWGRGLRRSIAAWYQRDVDTVAYQAVKYQQREGWSHRDLLRKTHPTAPTHAHSHLYDWIASGEASVPADLPKAVQAFLETQAAKSVSDVLSAIDTYGNLVTRETVPSQYLTSPEVWGALLENGLPMTALIRNLGNLTRYGVLTDQSAAKKKVVEELTDVDRLSHARIHPIAVLGALVTYQSGSGFRSDTGWNPVSSVVDALDEAFYMTFDNVPSSGKRIMLALDVSASMTWGEIAGMPRVSPRIGSAAMALVTAAREPEAFFRAFSHKLVPVSFSPKQRLDDVVRAVEALEFGGTDCALPMVTATKEKLEVDTFVVYTDSETWAGVSHPVQALRAYRDKSGIPAKLIVVGMEGNAFSIADPSDGGMLDVVGFDASAPEVMGQFIGGGEV